MRMRKKEWARPELAACPYYTANPEKWRGQWDTFFEKKQPIFLDLGCGKCEFLRQVAVRHPEINFIGIDQSDDVLGVGRRLIEDTYKEAGRDHVHNIALFAGDIEKLSLFLDPEQDKIAQIYINFCNPWPKARHHKRRLTYTKQLLMYRQFLNENGEIWFKTDNDDLFLSSQRYFREAGFTIYALTYDLHKENDPENAQSEHERMFTKQGIPTKALKARIDPSFVWPKAEEPDEDVAEEEPAVGNPTEAKALPAEQAGKETAEGEN